MSRFGSKVAVVEALNRVLPNEEPEASAVVAEAWAAEGITTHTGLRANNVAATKSEIAVTLEDGTGDGLFTHVAMYQANITIASILGEDHEEVNYDAMSRATFWSRTSA